MMHYARSFFFGTYFYRRNPPIPSCSNKHVADSCKRVFLLGFLAKPISYGSKQERYEGKTHDNTRNSKAKTPTKVILNVTKNNDPNCRACTQSEIPPVEE
ncbi:hypothetical protein HanIR_Chr02g0058351 [Helianthus annuus]|nr:hypothetical protein HanIR_Chr02g0058351 [Helianthus annuus]